MEARRDEQREGNHDEQHGNAVEPEVRAVAPLLPIRTQGDDLIGFAEGSENALGRCRKPSVVGREGVAGDESGLLDLEVTASAHDGHDSGAPEQPPHEERQPNAREQGPRAAVKQVHGPYTR